MQTYHCSVVHDRIEIISQALKVKFRRIYGWKITLPRCLLYILSADFDVLISVWSLMFVVETDGMSDFMDSQTNLSRESKGKGEDVRFIVCI